MASEHGERSVFAEQEPRREWLLRCKSSGGQLAICSIGVNAGEIDVVGPDDRELFTLEAAEIGAFHRAFTEAISLAEADLARH